MSKISLSKIKWKLFFLGKIYIPILGFTNPRIIELDDNSIRVRVKLRRRTKNHLKSMYFGALAVGADTAAGIHAFYHAENAGLNISFAFKSAEMEFLKRAESDVDFVCNEGMLIAELIQKSKISGERMNQPIRVVALNTSSEMVATFIMTISLKVK